MTDTLKLSHPQQLAYDWVMSHDQAALFMGMGMGKTATLLQAQHDKMCDGASRGALVVAPLRVATLTWPHEARRWFPSLKVCNLRSSADLYRMNKGEQFHLYVGNYEMLISRDISRTVNGKLVTKHHPGFIERYFNSLKRESPAFDTIIYDELTKVKSNSSAVTASLKPYFNQIPFRYGLTGTPIPNGYLDLWGQIYALDQGKTLFKTFFQYRNAFFDSDYVGYNWTLKAGAKERIDELISSIVLTLRASDFMDVPDTIYEDIEVPLSGDAEKTYRKLETELIVQLQRESLEIVALNGATLVGKLLQITGGAVYDEERNVQLVHDRKIKALVKLVKRINEPVLIAACYRHERPRIVDAVPGCVEWSDDLLDDWNAGRIPAIVADPRSIGHGLNLQDGGSNVVWFSRTWSRETYDQFNARVCGVRAMRSGKQPLVFHLTSPDTVDEAVAEALRQKDSEQSGLLAALVSLQEMRGLKK